MSDKTKIEWTDATWNPVTGCTKVSPGCDHCYAETIAHRFAGTKAYPNGFQVTLRPERLDQPLRWQRPRRVFVNSMSDLFHDDVPDEYIGSVFEVMAKAQQHTFQILTKRPGRMRSLLKRWAAQGEAEDWAGPGTAVFRRADKVWVGPIRWPLPNVWLGVSAEDQRWANVRVPVLLDTPAAVRFVSAEPLLGQLDLSPWLNSWHRSTMHRGQPEHLDWVIVGGESGHAARPMHPAWVRALRDQCSASDVVAFHFKQWGEWAPPPYGTQMLFVDKIRNGKTVQVGPQQFVQRVGKREAGRNLDGRTWDEFPDGGAA